MSESLAHKTNSDRANQRADARRSDQLDAGAMGTVQGVGTSPEGLRAVGETTVDGRRSTVKAKPRGERDEDSYVIDAGLKLLKVLECLEGRSCEPVTIKRAMQRSGFNRSFTHSALTTLKMAGWAKEILSGGREREFVLGPKAENLARALSAHLLKS